MESIFVEYSKINNLAQKKRSMENRVKEIADRLKSVHHRMDEDILNASGISRTLTKLESDMDRCSYVLQCMFIYLENASVRYKKCEDSVFEEKINNENIIGGSIKTPCNFSKANFTLDVLDKMGNHGSGIAGVLRPYANWIDKGKFDWSDKTGWQKGIDIMKIIDSGLIGAAGWMKSNADLKRLSRMAPQMAHKLEIKRLLGLDDVFVGAAKRSLKNKFTGWSSKFDYFFKNQIEEEAKSLTKNGYKSALKWGGMALSLAANAFQNYDEFKSGTISGERAVVETVTETACDIGKDILIGAGVAAVMAATVGSAPVLAVAVATVAVGAAVDFISNAAFGKNATEAFSDAVLDGYEKIGGALKDGVNKAGQSINDMFNSVANCFKNPIKIKVPWANVLGLI